MKRSSSENKGFTLIELVIVVAVLAILVGLLAPSYTKYVKKSKVTKCEAQRDEIEKAYQIACIEDSQLNGITNTIHIDKENVDPIIKRLADLGYFTVEEAVCPVYKENYSIVISTDKQNVKSVEVQCPCVNNLLSYIALANKVYSEIYKPGASYDRRDLIKQFYNERGSLIEVSSSLKSGTVFETKKLYWRPYSLNGGKVVLYASPVNDGGHAQWKASLIYIDGKIYQSEYIDKNGNHEGYPVDSLKDYSGDNFDKWLTDDSKGKMFKLVKA